MQLKFQMRQKRSEYSFIDEYLVLVQSHLDNKTICTLSYSYFKDQNVYMHSHGEFSSLKIQTEIGELLHASNQGKKSHTKKQAMLAL